MRPSRRAMRAALTDCAVDAEGGSAGCVAGFHSFMYKHASVGVAVRVRCLAYSRRDGGHRFAGAKLTRQPARAVSIFSARAAHGNSLSRCDTDHCHNARAQALCGTLTSSNKGTSWFSTSLAMVESQNSANDIFRSLQHAHASLACIQGAAGLFRDSAGRVLTGNFWRRERELWDGIVNVVAGCNTDWYRGPP